MGRVIFISYRESDAKGWAVLLRDSLAARFGADAIFFDKDGLSAGAWDPQLDAALAESRTVLVLIGSTWLDAKDAAGNRRLEDPTDVHRREVATALHLATQTLVIPVLLGGAARPSAQSLTEDLRALAQMQTYELSDRAERREQDIERLVEAIARATKLVPVPIAPKRSLWERVAPTLRATSRSLVVAFVAAVVYAVGSEASAGRRVPNSEVAVVAALVFTLTLVVLRAKMKRQLRAANHGLPPA
jgi:hypothetical protein